MKQFLLLFLFLLSCNNKQKEIQTYLFHPPIIDSIHHSYDSLPYLESKVMRIADYGFKTVLPRKELHDKSFYFDEKILEEYYPYETSSEEGYDAFLSYLETLRSNNVKIFVDTTYTINHKIRRKKSDPLQVKGYRVWIATLSDSLNRFFTEDRSTIAIQEALSPDNQWKPIEYWQWGWCGSGRYFNQMSGENYAYFSIPRYKGTFDTKLRLKVLNHTTVLYSNEFNGSIHLEQFNIPKKFNDSQLNRFVKEGKSIDHIFLEPFTTE
ncbi:hypothetical protein MY04_4649 [Flammeovirga sp. MY04]|uniref:hypothetical protein n=1 Tax=Flammeovirga sp. MY04 TaxID=1191459 RepID=UPI0008062AB2|nr:hypothetical protein [Flammeovirga sp. MY04]ANQ51984.1 hypothetical protein MY04_4649 [Flammeovirga sp. MY04]